VQHLSGVGHTVRMQRLGQALAPDHDVTVLDGGSALSFPPTVQTLPVARLARIDDALAPLDASLSLDAALAQRSGAILAHVQGTMPDVVLVEHYPFSKWELETEILGLIDGARRANPSARIIASLRDISPATRHEQVPDYPGRVLDRLHRHFDALLVHADPALCTLDLTFAQAGDIRLPVYHTGIIAPHDTVAAQGDCAPPATGRYVVASVGGGRDRAGLLQRMRDAWRTLRDRGVVHDLQLILFGGLGAEQGARGDGMSTEDGIVHRAFADDFRAYLGHAALSVSCAGYNTCADLLATGTPALLVPNTAMSDQLLRARLLDGLGLASWVPEPAGGSDPLADAIERALRKPRGHARATVDLDGARRSGRIIDELLETTPAR
jgi:predicted glycosyltransferase